SSNWSCAYDAVVTCLAAMYKEQPDSWRNSWRNESAAAQLLAIDFNTALSSAGFRASSLDDARDHMRDLLYAANPSLFPRYGAVGTAAVDILDVIAPRELR
ncbi:hypothetical protein FA13DRAFT_1588864, partial [Coprinellus micaceus]